jgi:hypothetical protein
MDPLQRLLHLAVERGVLNQILPRSKRIKASLYADDIVIFVRPTKHDVSALKEILDMFGQASGLCTNLQKTEVFLIGCNELPFQEILDRFPAQVCSFPCRYLGLPLYLKKLRKIDFMPLLDKVRGKLPGWKGKLMTKAARAQLVKSVLTSIVTYRKSPRGG